MSYKIRDRRNKEWFQVDNEYLNGYGKIFGAVGTAIYVSLCRHANMETQQCFPSMKLIAEEFNLSEETVRKYIKLFEQSRVISIERSKDPETKRQNVNIYTLLDKSQWLKTVQNGHEKSTETRPNVLRSDPTQTNRPTRPKQTGRPDPSSLGITRLIYNKTNNNNASDANASREIVKIIDLFEKINPSYKRWYSNKTERGAIQRMLDLHGFEKLSAVVAILPQSNVVPYVPIITSPFLLEKKWADLEAALRKIKNKSDIKNPKIIFS